MLYREPKLLKFINKYGLRVFNDVSVLYREPKLLKSREGKLEIIKVTSFSALP